MYSMSKRPKTEGKTKNKANIILTDLQSILFRFLGVFFLESAENESPLRTTNN